MPMYASLFTSIPWCYIVANVRYCDLKKLDEDDVIKAFPGNPEDRPTARNAGEERKYEGRQMKNVRRKIEKEMGD